VRGCGVGRGVPLSIWVGSGEPSVKEFFDQ